MSAKSRFKVAAWSIIAINRMKYLVRKYQRYLLKSSPTYEYKEKPQRGSSTTVRNQMQLPLANKALAREPDGQLYHVPTHPAKQPRSNNSSANSELSTDDMLPLKPIVAVNNKSPVVHQETVLSSHDYREQDKTKPMILQDLFPSPPEVIGQTYRIGSQNRQQHQQQQQQKANNVNTPLRGSPGDRVSYETAERGSLDRNGDIRRVTGREYRNSGRGFDSLRSQQQQRQQQKSPTSPPKSYPRLKSVLLHDEDFIPTKLENSSRGRTRTNATDHSRDTSRFSSTVLDGLGSSDNNTQEELKGYMKKLEDLQRRLKSQATESKRSRSSRRPDDDDEF